MTYELVRTARGKETVVDEGSLPKLNNRLKQLRASTRKGVSGRGGQKYAVSYKVRAKAKGEE